MRVGILSDSHGRRLAVRKAVALFQELGVEHIIHCGDVGGEAVFEELLAIPCTVVWGNTDLQDPSLIAYMGELGLAVPDGFPKMLSLDGKRFAVFHGHEPEFEHALRTLGVDYVLHGHSHQVRDERLHGKRVINPGALHRVRRKTVAVLETDTDELTFHEIRGA